MMGIQMGIHKGSFLLIVTIISAISLTLVVVLLASLASVQAATVQSYVYGDADNDGDIDSFDLVVERNIILGGGTWNPYGDASGDGDVDSADLAQMRNIILGRSVAQQGYEASYDFNTTGAAMKDLAARNNIPSRPTDIYINEAGWTDFSSGNYDDVKAVDADSFIVSGQAGNKSATECRFTVDEIGSLRNCISALGIEVRGNTSTDATMQYWVWNFSSNLWTQVSGNITIGTIEATYVKWSENWGKVFANHINDQGHVYILIILDTGNIDQIIDYIKLKLVTGCQGLTPTLTESPSPTVTGTGEPTLTPTELPTQTATTEPTPTVTVSPTIASTGSPTVLPTGSPTVLPTLTPTPTVMETVVITPTPTPTSTLVSCEHAYDFVGVTMCSGPHDAYYLSIYNMPPPHWRWYLLKTEATNGEYAAISASDGLRWQTNDPGWSRHVLAAFEMIIDEAPTSVNRIDLVFEGYGEVDSAFEIWAYNFVTGKGERIGSKVDIPTGFDSTMVCSIVSNCGNYISGNGKVIWGVYEKETTSRWFTDGYWMAIDYAKLVVTTTCP